MPRSQILTATVCILSAVFAEKAQADATISTDFIQNGGILNITPPTLLITNPIGNPQLTLTGGATTSNVRAVIVGAYSGDEGRLLVNNGSKLVNSGDGSPIGNYGMVPVFAGRGYIGANAGASGVATVSGAGSQWTNSGLLALADSGTATLTIENGGLITNTEGHLASFSSSSVATATVTGAGSQWTNSSSLFVGGSGSGGLNIQNGGKVVNTFGFVGYNPSAHGNVTVSGQGSQWIGANTLTVGSFGAGTVLVENGGKLSSSFGSLGVFTGASGAVTIKGAGSQWTISNNLDVGAQGNDNGVQVGGNGTLNIESGGTVTNNRSIIGRHSSSNSTATVTGANSTWTMTDSLYVGGTATANGGIGTLNILDSGLVSVTGLTKLWNGDTVTVNGGTLSTGSLDRSLGTFNFYDGFVKINGGTYTAASSLAVSGNSTTANPSLQLLSGATNAAGSVPYVVVGNAASRKGDLLISGGSKLNNTGSGDLGYGVGATGTAKVSGAGSEWNNASSFIAGVDGTGTLLVEAGGKLTGTSGHLGFRTGSVGTATVTGAGSLWISSAELYVGNDGSGTLNIEAGGKVTNTVGLLGYAAGSSGAVTVTGVGSEWANSGNLFVGNTATGTLSIEAGGKVSSGTSYLGLNPGSNGTATVTGAGSEWNSSSRLVVGRHGTGTLSVEAGGHVANTGGYIGDDTGSTGSVLVTGAGSLWTNSSNLYIGYLATGDLDIEAGGKVTNAAGYLGNNAGSVGTATVSGVGSQWNNTSDLRVGYNGTGTLNIEEGGKVSNLVAYLGAAAVSNGTATVTGAGSEWNATEVRVGYEGAGTLNVEAGGKVTDTTGTLGNWSGSTGTATITGAGSEWSNSADLYVGGRSDGNGGIGSLSITDSGLVSVGGLTKIWDGDTVTVNSGTLSTGSLDRSLGTFNHYDGLVKINGGTYTQAGTTLAVDSNAADKTATLELAGGGSHSTITQVIVGNFGRGVLRITNGRTFTNDGHAHVGFNNSGDGEATISGTDSLWQNSQILNIGYAGKGKLRVEDGGTLTSYAGNLALNLSAPGEATVNGSGSQWQNTDQLHIGLYGPGKLTIENGGTVSNTDGFLGFFNTGVGEAVVTGSGSVWQNSRHLILGGTFLEDATAGVGTLTVENGGLVTVGGTLKLHGGGTLRGNDGTIEGNIVNAGIVAPGSSAGVMTIDGDFTQEAAGSLQIELGGPAAGSQFDQLFVTGNLSLGGTLAVSLIDGFTPTVGDSFDILDWTTLTATFDVLELPELDGLVWNTTQLYTMGAISVALSGDFDLDGDVDGRDFLSWQRGGSPNPLSSADLAEWQTNYGTPALVATAALAVPEPTGVLFGSAFVLSAFAARRGRPSAEANSARV